LVIYQVALAGHWLIMGLKTDISLVHAPLSKMDAAIENIVSLGHWQPCDQPTDGA
jgi:hypothetical protein